MKKLILCIFAMFLVSCGSFERGPASEHEICKEGNQFVNEQSYFRHYERCKNY